MKPGPRAWLLLSVMAVTPALTISARADERPLRNTFSVSVGDMVERYNKFMISVDRSLILPPAKKLTPGAKNPLFHTLEHKVSSQIKVSFEIDNATGKPFSISLLGYASSNQNIAEMLAVMGALGVTTFGKGTDAGSVHRVCAAAAKSKSNTHEIRVQDLNVFCTSVQGVWIAGVSVPKVLPASAKL